MVDAAPDDYVAAAQLGLLYLPTQPELAMPILRNVLTHADAATANRVRMALKMPLVLENRATPDSQVDPRILGERSYQAGFLKDAKRYFLVAREQNPVDASLALKLGWTNNMLHDDASALRWFDVARQSADPAIASEAARAYGNLRPGVELLRTTLWAYPLYSSRWNDLFGYGQVKTEVRLREKKVHPYVSVRFVGDARQSTQEEFLRRVCRRMRLLPERASLHRRGAERPPGLKPGRCSGTHIRLTIRTIVEALRMRALSGHRLRRNGTDGFLKRRTTKSL